MDSFHYFYGTGTDGYRQNQLKMLNDSATIDRTVDIAHNTSTMPNFYYDLIGNLTKDLVNGQDTINWNLYNKVDAVANVNGSSLAYEYDAQGNRVGKKYTLPDGNEKSDYYVHDAQGHTLAVYHHNKNYDPGGFAGLKDESFSLAEHDIYGSSRLGVRKYWEPVTIDTVWHAGQIGNTWDYHNFRFDTVRLWERKPWYSLEYQDNIIDTAHDYIANTFTDNSSGSATTGQKMFELTDHLGNVLATVSDKRFPMSSGADTTTIAYYTPVLHSIQDYYPFGMPMPGQTWESSTSDCQNVTQTALMPIHNYVEITVLNSDFLPILGASLTTAPLAFKVTATPPNQGFSYNIAPVVPNLAQQIKIYFHAPTPFILNYKVAQSGCSLPMNTIPPGTKNYTIYFTPCNLNAIQLLITAPSVFATTTIVIDSIVKDSISFTPELVITKVCDEGVYEYGYNGQLKDNEWSGNGNHNTALFWEYDTRIGRRGNLDPVKNPSVSPFATFGNNPVLKSDVLGNVESVHTDDQGNILRNYNDKDNSVYEHQAGTTASDVDKKYTANDHSAGGRKVGELGGTIDVNNSLRNALDANKQEINNGWIKMTPIGWFIRVKKDGKWDYKNNQSTIYGVAWAYDLAQTQKTGIDKHTNFYFKGLGVNGMLNAADVGNYNAGYTGTYVGLWPIIQKIGAGHVEQFKQDFNGTMWNPIQYVQKVWLDKYYGDMPTDYLFNCRGMNDAQKEIDNAPKPKPIFFK